MAQFGGAAAAGSAGSAGAAASLGGAGSAMISASPSSGPPSIAGAVASVISSMCSVLQAASAIDTTHRARISTPAYQSMLGVAAEVLRLCVELGALRAFGCEPGKKHGALRLRTWPY